MHKFKINEMQLETIQYALLYELKICVYCKPEKLSFVET